MVVSAGQRNSIPVESIEIEVVRRKVRPPSPPGLRFRNATAPARWIDHRIGGKVSAVDQVGKGSARSVAESRVLATWFAVL
jgi:hypothetical protein